jgi:MATE family multidrug resistance protein
MLHRLSSFSTGLIELLLLFLPIALMLFSSYLFLFMEKVLLAQYSAPAMQAAVNATYAINVTQLPCIAIASMAQVYVGQWKGAQNWNAIGQGVWQFIWFAVLSMGLTVPFNILFGSYYFQDTTVEDIVWPYFYLLTFISFLFPLGTVLTSYYLGLGKTRLVLFTSIISQIIKLGVTYLLIFGWGSIIPGLGLMGGAIGTLIAQGLYCLILFLPFIYSKNANAYATRSWRLQPRLFLSCTYPGIVRSIGRLSMLLSWASISRLMAAKGGNYLLILSIGGSLFLFLPFLSDAICQALVTLLSNNIGAKNYHKLKGILQTGLVFLGLILAILAIPFLLFPSTTYHYFFPTIPLSEESIRLAFLGIWTSFVFFALCNLPLSYILAMKDTRSLMFMGLFNWINGYLFMYLAIEYFHLPADYFWLALTFMHLTIYLFYQWRSYRLNAKLLEEAQALS